MYRGLTLFLFFQYPGIGIKDQPIWTVFFKRPALVEYKMYYSKRNDKGGYNR